ncbi:MAG: SLBB domain-containing protein [Terracidiphilus sp.]
MPDISVHEIDIPKKPETWLNEGESRRASSTSLRALWEVLVRRRMMVVLPVLGFLLACSLYCLFAPKEYEATAKVAVRTSPASSINLDASDQNISASILSGPLQQETLANVFRSDQLAWRVITELQLYQAAGFRGSFPYQFPNFVPRALASDDPASSSAPADTATGGYVQAQAWLLERFHRRLNVESMPRTMLIRIRFRSRDAALSAQVVNTLIKAYAEQESESRVLATGQASDWLGGQLKGLKTQVDQDEERLAIFQKERGIISTPELLANGQATESQHTAALLEIDELGRQLVEATADRVLREAEYRTASQGDPELVISSDARMQGESGLATALLEQIHARRSTLEQEQAQLGKEHGPNFPRMVEIREELLDLDRQRQAEDAKLLRRFESFRQTAIDREQSIRKSLDEQTEEGMKVNQAAIQYSVMREEANRSHELYMQVRDKVAEAGLSAGTRGSSISVVDYARQPVKPVSPDFLLYMAVTLFAGFWLSVGGALLLESLEKPASRVAVTILILAMAGGWARGQAPTPSTSGLPTGVTKIPQTVETREVPNAKNAPSVWNSASDASLAGAHAGDAQAGTPMPAAIAPGDILEISEYHTPEFHSVVRVTATGVVMLPLVNEVSLGGLDEESAALAVEAALVAKGMLLHPLVSVLVRAQAGQDMSVLGEVVRPGVYAYSAHHRLLDVISQASGVAPGAGRVVNILHRSDPNTPHGVALDPEGADPGHDHNPELSPGDTVVVSRAGLVYVVGDVIRPGGFPVDSAHGLTVLQALSLAWGSTQNAASSRALLIREQKGGRALITLNLKRMLRGQDPDQPIHDRDILFVPDSMAKNLINRTLESAIQSAIGVSIYSGLVYSQRY